MIEIIFWGNAGYRTPGLVGEKQECYYLFAMQPSHTNHWFISGKELFLSKSFLEDQKWTRVVKLLLFLQSIRNTEKLFDAMNKKILRIFFTLRAFLKKRQKN